MSIITLFVLLLQLNFITNEYKVAAKIVYFKSSEVAFNPLYLQDHRLDVHNGTMDIILNVRNDFKLDPWFKVAFRMKSGSKSEEYRTLLQYDVNICHLLTRRSTALIKYLLDNFLNQGNFPKTCPIRKGNYSVIGLNVDMLGIPGFIRKAQYKAQIDTYLKIQRKQVSLANLTVFAEIK